MMVDFPICRRIQQLSNLPPELWLASIVRALPNGIKAGVGYLDRASRPSNQDVSSI
jgi:hypothetical protein